jgi:hypothetical protein
MLPRPSLVGVVQQSGSAEGLNFHPGAVRSLVRHTSSGPSAVQMYCGSAGYAPQTTARSIGRSRWRSLALAVVEQKAQQGPRKSNASANNWKRMLITYALATTATPGALAT